MPDIAAITRELDLRLPDMARDVIQSHLDPTDPWTEAFLQRPDDREQHQTDWHQWGIISHTRMFLRHFDTTVPGHLREWSLWDAVETILRQEVDGESKWTLLRISIVLHDIGKFAARRRGRTRFHFSGHEHLSGEIVRKEVDLVGLGLTPDQAEYVARTAEDHFVLGEVRRRAREHGEYDLDWVRGQAFRKVAREIVTEHPEDFIEIGVLFLGDSLAKANPGEGPDRAVSQNVVNLETARRYLKMAVNSP